MAARIRAENLTKSFPTTSGTVTAFSALNLSVAAGEFLCVTGPSGCGKTSLLRVVAGLESPTNGELTVEKGAGGPRPRMAMAFQEHGLLPWASLVDNITLVLHESSASDAKDQALALLKRVGLADFANLYPHQVSGGMRQRASIARALAVGPDLLLMDEPFVFLDYQTRSSLQRWLLEQWEGSGKTVVFVTHDLEEAVLLADRILVLTPHPGQIKAEFAVDLPRPRRLDTLRLDPEFHTLAARLADAVQSPPSPPQEPAGQ